MHNIRTKIYERFRVENSKVSNNLIQHLTTVKCLCESNKKLDKLTYVLLDLYAELKNKKPLYDTRSEMDFMNRHIEEIKNINKNRNFVLKKYKEAINYLGTFNSFDTKDDKIAKSQFQQALNAIQEEENSKITPESSMKIKK